MTTEEEVTPRQVEMLAEVGNGLKMEEIAKKMHLSYHTVRNSLDDARERTGARTLPHAIVHGIARGHLKVSLDGEVRVSDEMLAQQA